MRSNGWTCPRVGRVLFGEVRKRYDGDAMFLEIPTFGLRARGLSLPDVTRLEPHRGQTVTGSFVKVSDDVAVQHSGQGVYQVLDIERDLNGVVPPDGKNVSIDAQGHVSEGPAPSLARP